MNDVAIKVLLALGNQDGALLIQEALSSARPGRFEMVFARSLSETLDRLGSEGIEVVLLDVSLPDAMGLKGLSKLTDFAPEIPVVMLSDRDNDALALEAVRSGAQDYLVIRRSDGHAIARSIGYSIERHTFRQALRASEARYRAMVETAEEGVWVVDAHDLTSFANRKLADLLGFAPEEMAGRSFFSFMDPEEELLARAHRERRRAAIRDVRNFKFRRKDGSPVWTLCATSPLFDESGRHAETLVMVTDMTARQSLEEQLRQAQKMEAVGRLAGGVAHDFNNLLQVIGGYGTFALSALGPKHPASANLGEVMKAADRAASLTRQLLAFSRKQVFSPKVLNLNSVVTDMEKMLRRLIEEQIQFETLLAPDLMNIRGDLAQAEQVLMNLVVNARDAMPKGGKLSIETRNVTLDRPFVEAHPGSAPGPHVLLSVSDTGVGMDRETLSHLFEPFFTTKAEGKGTGLGLATVYGIVKQSGGYVVVESEPSRGTTFKIYLPRVDEVESASGITRRITILSGKETVLLVEDESAVRRLLREILTSNGYTVLEAENGQETLALCGRPGAPIPDVLVTDMIMPGMSGRELSRKLLPTYPGMKVLILSGYTDDLVLRQGGLDPGTAFLQKPFASEDLLRTIRKLLR